MYSPEAPSQEDSCAGSPEAQMTNTDAVDKVMATYELVEMIVCELPLGEIARAQRVCRTFRDIIKSSSPVRRLVSSQPWISIRNTEDVHPRPPLPADWKDHFAGSTHPLRCYIVFDNGPNSPPSARSFRTIQSFMLAHGPREVALDFYSSVDRISRCDRKHASIFTPTQSTASCEVWRKVSITTHPDWTVRVSLNRKWDTEGHVESFSGSTTLGELYDSLSLKAFGDKEVGGEPV